LTNAAHSHRVMSALRRDIDLNSQRLYVKECALKIKTALPTPPHDCR
jgi:hypothetical protein